jgi:hypothetical protein
MNNTSASQDLMHDKRPSNASSNRVQALAGAPARSVSEDGNAREGNPPAVIRGENPLWISRAKGDGQ